MSNVETKHIELRPTVDGGEKACVSGTRIRVWDIHVWHTLRGLSPEEIVAQYPQLSVADVYAALAYYHDHRDAIEAQAREDEKLADRMAGEQGPTRFTQLRDALFGNTDAGDTSLSSR